MILSEAARAALLRHPWHGNVRELRNVLDLAMLFARGGAIAEEHLKLARESRPERMTAPRADSGPIEPDTPEPSSLETAEWLENRARRPINREHVMRVLAACGGNQTLAAIQLKVGRRTLCRWLDGLQIPRPRKRPLSAEQTPAPTPEPSSDTPLPQSFHRRRSDQ